MEGLGCGLVPSKTWIFDIVWTVHHFVIYVVRFKSFRPDIQKPRQMENSVRDIYIYIYIVTS